jgi:hypothetical protein
MIRIAITQAAFDAVAARKATSKTSPARVDLPV